MKIRKYTPEDKAACLQAFCSNVPTFFTESEIADFDGFLDTFHLKPGENKTYFYVLQNGSDIIACGGFGDRYGDDVITLAWGLVHKNYHKQGFGQQLLKHRLEQIKLYYPTKLVYLDTTQYSYGFYEKYGFKTTKITEDFYAPNMHRYDMVYGI